jgi:hypothetical protein
MDAWVVIQSPTGQQRQVQVTERSSDEKTMQAGMQVAQRSWPDKCEGWLPVCVASWQTI